jgi:hypothetical protein
VGGDNKEFLIKPFNGLFDHTDQDQDDTNGFNWLVWAMKQRFVVVLTRFEGMAQTMTSPEQTTKC